MPISIPEKTNFCFYKTPDFASFKQWEIDLYQLKNKAIFSAFEVSQIYKKINDLYKNDQRNFHLWINYLGHESPQSLSNIILNLGLLISELYKSSTPTAHICKLNLVILISILETFDFNRHELKTLISLLIGMRNIVKQGLYFIDKKTSYSTESLNNLLSRFIMLGNQVQAKQITEILDILSILAKDNILTHNITAINSHFWEYLYQFSYSSNENKFLSLGFDIANLGILARNRFLNKNCILNIPADIVQQILNTCQGKELFKVTFILQGLAHLQLHLANRINIKKDILKHFENDKVLLVSAIYALGIMAKNCGYITQIEINNSIIENFYSAHLDIKNATNLYYGLSCLAMKNLYKETIYVNPAIVSKILASQDIVLIAQFIYSLGVLAKAGCLGNMITLEENIIAKLSKLLGFSAQPLGYIVAGCGFLAEANKVTHPIKIGKDILQNLTSHPKCTYEDVQHALDGIASFSRVNGLLEKINNSNSFMRKLILMNLRKTQLKKLLNVLEELMQSNCLNVSSNVYEDLFTYAATLVKSESNIKLNLILNLLGQLAMDYSIKSKILDIPIDLIKNNFTFRNINTDTCLGLYGAGLLVQKNLLAQFSIHFHPDILIKIYPDVSFEMFWRAIYGLKLLSKNNYFTGKINLPRNILKDTEAIIPKHILINFLYCVEDLIKIRKLNGYIELDVNLIKRMFCDQILDTIEFTKLLNALHCLSQTNKLIILGEWQEHFFTILIKLNNVNARQAGVILNSLISLKYIFSEKDILILEKLINGFLTDKFHHPINAYLILHNLLSIEHLHHHFKMNDLFHKILSSIDLTINCFPDYLQEMILSDTLLLGKPNKTTSPWRIAIKTHFDFIHSVNNEISEQEVINEFHDPISPESDEIEFSFKVTSKNNNAHCKDITALPPASSRKRSTSVILTSKNKKQKTSNHLNEKEQEIVEALLEPLYSALYNKNIEALKQCLELTDQKIKQILSNKSNHANGEGNYADKTDKSTERYIKTNFIMQFFEKRTFYELKVLAKRIDEKHLATVLYCLSFSARYRLAKEEFLHAFIVYMDFKGLEDFANRLFGTLAIYRDSHATIKIMDAFMLRLCKSNLHEKEILRTLIKAKFQHAHEFHRKSNHHYVIEKLEIYLTHINKKINQLIDLADDTETDEATELLLGISQLTSSEETLSITAPPVPNQPTHLDTVITYSNKPPSANDGNIQENYFYEELDIAKIMDARIYYYQDKYNKSPGEINVAVLTAAHYSTIQSINHNKMIDVLTDYLIAHPELKEKTIMIPIHRNNHWVGLKLEMKNRQIVAASYYNSIHHPIEAEAETIRYYNELKFLFSPSCQKVEIEKKVQRQTDGSSCGAALTANFYCAIKGFWFREDQQPSMKHIREWDAEILKQYDPEYYKIFINKQNGTQDIVPSLAVQNQNHVRLGKQTQISTYATLFSNRAPSPINMESSAPLVYKKI